MLADSTTVFSMCTNECVYYMRREERNARQRAHITTPFKLGSLFKMPPLPLHIWLLPHTKQNTHNADTTKPNIRFPHSLSLSRSQPPSRNASHWLHTYIDVYTCLLYNSPLLVILWHIHMQSCVCVCICYVPSLPKESKFFCSKIEWYVYNTSTHNVWTFSTSE